MNRRQITVERNSVWVYVWLFLSPLITVPCLFAQLFTQSYAQPSARLFNTLVAILISSIPQAVLLFGLLASQPYARRHAQQALLFAAGRILATLFILGATSGWGACLWVLVNGALWVWGSAWGVAQLQRGDCWLMRRLGEGNLLPRPWAIAEPKPTSTRDSNPDSRLAMGRQLAAQGRKAEAVKQFMAIFRSGSPALRREALTALEQLGEVETF